MLDTSTMTLHTHTSQHCIYVIYAPKGCCDNLPYHGGDALLTAHTPYTVLGSYESWGCRVL